MDWFFSIILLKFFYLFISFYYLFTVFIIIFIAELAQREVCRKPVFAPRSSVVHTFCLSRTCETVSAWTWNFCDASALLHAVKKQKDTTAFSACYWEWGARWREKGGTLSCKTRMEKDVATGKLTRLFGHSRRSCCRIWERRGNWADRRPQHFLAIGHSGLCVCVRPPASVFVREGLAFLWRDFKLGVKCATVASAVVKEKGPPHALHVSFRRRADIIGSMCRRAPEQIRPGFRENVTKTLNKVSLQKPDNVFFFKYVHVCARHRNEDLQSVNVSSNKCDVKNVSCVGISALSGGSISLDKWCKWWCV